MAPTVRDDLSQTLLECSFRGVPFAFESMSVIGGRKSTPRPILNSDEQIISDVGLRQPVYTVRGYVAAVEHADASAEGGVRTDLTYHEHRKTLLAALKQREPATFVHPIEGSIDGLVAQSWTVDEARSDLGAGRVSIEFVRDTTRPTPIPVVGVASAVVAAVGEVRTTFLAELTQNWGVDPAIVGAYEDGLTKARAAFETMQDIADEAENLTDGVDALATATSEGIAAATRLILVPVELATHIGNAFMVLKSVFPSVVAAFDGLVLGFDFGDLDFAIDLTVPSAAARKRNSDAMNQTVKAHLLADAYEAALGLEYLTLDEVERVEGILSAQHQVILDAGTASAEAVDTLESLRLAFSDFLSVARVTARRVVEDETAPTTPRLLAFALYGDDALAPTLAALNGVYSYEVVSGPVTVLSP